MAALYRPAVRGAVSGGEHSEEIFTKELAAQSHGTVRQCSGRQIIAIVPEKHTITEV